LDKSLNAIHLLMPATWIRAQALMKLGEYRSCMQACGRIMWTNLKDSPQAFSDYKLSAQFLRNFQKLQKKARKLYFESREAYDTKTYGKDFAQYRKAREAQFASNFSFARDLYAQIKNGTLKEAAACYTGECLILEGSEKKALNIFEKKIRENPTGFYRGEMLYQKAIVEYLDNKVSKALVSAKELTEWCAKVSKEESQKDKTVKLEGINDALHAEIINTAPKSFLQLDACGNLIATAKYPETINNRLTSPWYLPNLMVRGELLYAFLLSQKNQVQDAAVTFEKAATMTPMQIIKDRYAIENLKASLHLGYYTLNKDMKKSIKEYFNHLNLAFFFYLSDNKSEAERLFDYVIRKTSIDSSPGDVAAARLGKVYCLLDRRYNEEAIKLIDNTINNAILKRSPAIPEMRYLKACFQAQIPSKFLPAIKEFLILSNSSIELGSGKLDRRKRNRRKGDRVKTNTSYMKTTIAPRALLSAALAAVNACKNDLAQQICKEMMRKYSDHPFAQTISTLSCAIKQKESAGNKIHPIGMIENKNGKVILHRRVVVTPGAAQWINLEEKTKVGDIVLYQIKFIPRSDCTIIRGIWVTLSPGEPSPPDAVGDEICFVRAPALFQLNLQINNAKTGGWKQ